jgi:hypothetical protein
MPDTMPEMPDHPHRTGHGILDFVIAGCAVVISVVSLWVAVRAGQTQQQLLQSSVWPYVEYDTSDATAEGRKHILFELRNAGVGPAIVRSFAVAYRGQYYATLRDLMTACCNTAHNVLASTVRDTVLMAHDSLPFITVLPERVDSASYNRILAARFDIKVRMCYCSVLGDCWFFDQVNGKLPTGVRECPPAQQPQYNT